MSEVSADGREALKSFARSAAVAPHGDTRIIRLLYGAVLLSGFAGLGYQMAWTRMLSVSLGHEFSAVLAVITAFFVGLALGGLVFNSRIRQTAFPLRWYVGLELSIGLWALGLILIMPQYNHLSAHLIGSEPHPLWHWSVAFTTSLLVLLPATLAMGATLPAAHRLAQSLEAGHGGVAGFYAVNTLGAMLGTLIATYWLLPNLGLNQTLLLFALVNLGVAAFCWLWLSRTHSEQAITDNSPSEDKASHADTPILHKPDPRRLVVLFLTGLLGLGYEILVVRVLAQILEGTVYSFAAVLSVYLLGTALGAAIYHRWLLTPAQGRAQASMVSTRLLTATSLLCLLGTGLLWATEAVYLTVMGQLGPGSLAAMLAELSVAAMVFLPPTMAMGALFSHLAQQTLSAHGLGFALGVNTLGAAIAPALFGVVLLPWLGALPTLVVLSLGYCGLPWLLQAKATNWRYPFPAVAVASVLLLVSGPLRFVSVPDGSELLTYKEGVIAAVAVIEEPDGSRHLKVNNRFTMGGTASRFSDHRQTHLPLLWHGGQAQSALYLGLGTGITFQAAQYYPNLAATGVELVPEMLPLMPQFGVDVKGSHWPHAPRVIAADARRFVVASNQQYDVIIAEVFHPSRDGAGALYTVEHFSAIRERLAPRGLFCQWLPLFQLDLDTLRLIIRSYLEVFPNAQLHLAHYSLRQPLLCLLGGEALNHFRADWLINRVHHSALQRQLVGVRLNSDFALFGGYLGGPAALRGFADSAPLNTDDRPRVIFQAPGFVYGDPASPGERLLELVQSLAPQRGTLLAQTDASSEFGGQLIDYWQARDLFLAAGIDIEPTTDIRKMIAQTRQKLLAAVRTSGDFLPAYDSLLQMAKAVYPLDPLLARDLLQALDRANPEMPDAQQLLEQMSSPMRRLREP